MLVSANGLGITNRCSTSDVSTVNLDVTNVPSNISTLGNKILFPLLCFVISDIVTYSYTTPSIALENAVPAGIVAEALVVLRVTSTTAFDALAEAGVYPKIFA